MFNEVSKNWKAFVESNPESSYNYANELKEELLSKYRNFKLEDVIKGEILKSNEGESLLIFSKETINFNIKKHINVQRDQILDNLKLIYGIGELTEKKLKNSGVKTIEELLNYPYFADKAREIIELIEERNIKELYRIVRNRTSKSHPLLLKLSLLNDLENFTFLDIETLGLFARPIILIGTAKIFPDGSVFFKQYFVRNISEEKVAIEVFLRDLSKDTLLVTYNGEGFDVPYIENRLNHFRLGKILDLPDLDLLLFARRKWKGALPNCKLVTVEKYILGSGREKDVPSAAVPDFYETYLRTNNIGPIIPIIEHNREDILSLIKIYFTICEEF